MPRRPAPWTLERIAEHSRASVREFFTEQEWNRFVAMPALEQVQYRYCHADCDDFAAVLQQLTGWQGLSIQSASGRPLHRLLQAPDGRMVDASGWVTEDRLCMRYRTPRLVIRRASAFDAHCDLDEPEDYHPHVAALHVLPSAPFSTNAFRAKLALFAMQKNFPGFKATAPAARASARVR